MLEIIQQHISQRGDRAALVDFVLGPITWRQLGDCLAAAIVDLQDYDLSEPLIHDSANDLSDVIMALAVASVGGIEAPLDVRLDPAERARRVKLLGGQVLPQRQKTTWLQTSTQHASVLATTQPPVGKTILWTSGTTKAPRGVIQTHAAWLGNAAAKLAAVPQTDLDIRLTMLPLSHAYARTCDLGTWLLSGGTLAVTLGRKGLLHASSLVRPTLINTVPSVATSLLAENVEAIGLNRLRLLGVGGAPLSTSSFNGWKQRGVTVIQGYGLTETGPVICSATPEDARPGFVGGIVDGWETRVQDGELHVRGDHTMEGYWNDPVATQAKIPADGWLRTGDLVERDETSGQWRILGRIDDVIVLENGTKIHPTTIEREVESVPSVNHAFLLMRERLELWIDGDPISRNEIELLITSKLAFCQVAIDYFDSPLTIAAGELTSKRTIRRQRVMENRF